ncbi:MAG: PqqD family protein [Lachnospiraceae bacterium]|nr:PqqD family protein [Lachnospiraceae bacterium]
MSRMKLKDSFMTQDVDGTQFLIPLGEGEFSGIARSNETAAFIVNLMKQDTDRDSIIDALCGEYDAPREVIAEDVDKVLETLRGIGAVEE